MDSKHPEQTGPFTCEQLARGIATEGNLQFMGHAERGAVFSHCLRYRYLLWREWEPKAARMTFIGLNPSTADHALDDPTIRRCVNFAKTMGCGSLYMVNLFAFRATDPKNMKHEREPVGHLNNDVLATVANNTALLVAAWGTHGTHADRAKAVCELFARHRFTLMCYGTTKDGHPRHPLYLPATAKLVRYASFPDDIYGKV